MVINLYKFGLKNLTCTSIHPYCEAIGWVFCSPQVEVLGKLSSQMEEDSGVLERPFDSYHIFAISTHTIA